MSKFYFSRINTENDFFHIEIYETEAEYPIDKDHGFLGTPIRFPGNFNVYSGTGIGDTLLLLPCSDKDIAGFNKYLNTEAAETECWMQCSEELESSIRDSVRLAAAARSMMSEKAWIFNDDRFEIKTETHFDSYPIITFTDIKGKTKNLSRKYRQLYDEFSV